MGRPRKPFEFEVNELGCHLCTSHAPNDKGYPVVVRDGKLQHVSRYLYEQHHSVTLPREIQIRHNCDDRRCINVSHLIRGTCGDNIRDRDKRGRTAKGVRHGSAKLDPAKVKTIRKSKEPPRVLAERLHVSVSTVKDVRRHRTWHL